MNCRVTTITSLCRWKPLRRFCSAVHNVDRACISVLSQVIRNVNEKKNRTDKYDFLREPWRWDSKNFVKLLLHKIFAQKSIGMPGEQEYHICLYDFSFSLYRKFLKSSEIVYNRLEIKNDIAKERRGLRHDVVYEVFCFGLG